MSKIHVVGVSRCSFCTNPYEAALCAPTCPYRQQNATPQAAYLTQSEFAALEKTGELGTWNGVVIRDPEPNEAPNMEPIVDPDLAPIRFDVFGNIIRSGVSSPKYERQHEAVQGPYYTTDGRWLSLEEAAKLLQDMDADDEADDEADLGPNMTRYDGATAQKHIELVEVPEDLDALPPDALPPNPKQRYGDRKVPLHYVPPASTIHEAQAFAEGARKYGAYNWRRNAVEALTYIGAAQRHILAYLDGEDYDPEIEHEVHHLGLAKACLGIILDALETGNLIDNRPPSGEAADLLRDLQKAE